MLTSNPRIIAHYVQAVALELQQHKVQSWFLPTENIVQRLYGSFDVPVISPGDPDLNYQQPTYECHALTRREDSNKHEDANNAAQHRRIVVSVDSSQSAGS